MEKITGKSISGMVTIGPLRVFRHKEFSVEESKVDRPETEVARFDSARNTASAGEYSRHGIRQRRAHVIDGNLIALRLLFLDPTRDGRFHAGKAEIVRMLLARFALGESLRHFDGMRVAQLRMTIDMRSARIGETEQASDLVEAFAGRIIKRGADHVDMTCDILNMQQGRVSAGHDQGERVFGERAELQLRDRNMPDHMVDAVNRLIRRPGKRFRAGHANGEAASKSRTCGHGDRVDVRQRHVRIGQRLGNAWHERFGVGA